MDDFYSRKKQFRRELRHQFRSMEWGDLAFATLLTLLCFYVLFSPGQSQVYDVAIPYLYATFHLTLLIFRQTAVERVHPTSKFYVNLPRTTSVTFFAKCVYFLGHAVYYEIVIALGVVIKLGGADITPYYRLHPEIMVLPVVAVLGSVWYCHGPRSLADTVFALSSVAVAFIALIVRYFSLPLPDLANNFLPPRDLPLPWAMCIALALLAGSMGLCWRIRNDVPTEERVDK